MQKVGRGFTLIELLVVIAIIGLLAAVVLASVSSARQKGVDAAIQSDLNSASTQVEVYASDHNNSYTSVCTATAANKGLGGLNGPGMLKNAANTAGKGGSVNITNNTKGSWNVVTCHSSNLAWAIEAPLSASSADGSLMWCVDSTGVEKRESANIQSNQFTCP